MILVLFCVLSTLIICLVLPDNVVMHLEFGMC